MKKHLTILLILLTTTFTVSYSQSFKPFRVGVGVGYAASASTGDGAGGGALFYIEPGYRATNNILIGLRLETNLVARGIEGVGKDDVSGDASSNVSYTLNGQYYFNDNYVRPFVGAGFGIFSVAAVKFNTADPDNSINADEASAETRFGFYPRIGVDVGHFTLSVDYNIIPKTEISGVGEIKNNYIGIRAGVAIGGGVGMKKNQ